MCVCVLLTPVRFYMLLFKHYVYKLSKFCVLFHSRIYIFISVLVSIALTVSQRKSFVHSRFCSIVFYPATSNNNKLDLFVSKRFFSIFFFLSLLFFHLFFCTSLNFSDQIKYCYETKRNESQKIKRLKFGRKMRRKKKLPT